MTRVRVFCVAIANGYSSEVRVMASLLRHRSPDTAATIACHQWAGGEPAAKRLAADAQCPIYEDDFGWRPNPGGTRSTFGKAVSAARFNRALPGLLAAARRFDPDIIYSSQQKWDCLAATIVARFLGKPHVVHLHYAIGPYLGKVTLARLRTCDHVVTVSEFIRDEATAHGVAEAKTTAVHNAMAPFPIDDGARAAVRAELGLPLATPLVGFIGRLEPGKGHLDVVHAFDQIRGAFPESHLIVVGTGSCREEIEREASALPSDDRIHFLGHRGDVPRLLAALDVFVHPSHRDAAPLAILEACASGVPVVAYSSGGVPEFVVDGQTGFLPTPGDVDGIALAMGTLLGDPQRAGAMGDASRERMATLFHPEDAAERFWSILGKVALDLKTFAPDPEPVAEV